jgi:hypothetical protein
MAAKAQWARRVREANAGKFDGAVYEVWQALLNALPDDLQAHGRACLKAMVNQAIAAHEDQTPLETKLGHLEEDWPTPVGSIREQRRAERARENVRRLWAAEAADHEGSVRGRFRGFNSGFGRYVTDEGARRVLETLREVATSGTDDEAVERAKDLFAGTNPPAGFGASRVSEYLHLTRPSAFPIVNDQVVEPLALILGVSGRELETPAGYFDHLELIAAFTARAKLADFKALDAFLDDLGDTPGVAEAFPPETAEDRRKRVLREITSRPDQGRFRARLLDIYEGRCAITGADCEYALEAAHIKPFGNWGSNRPTNGILLRADIHRMFDLLLIAIDERKDDLPILVSTELAGTGAGRELQGAKLRLPRSADHHPDREALREHRVKFVERQRRRPRRVN